MTRRRPAPPAGAPWDGPLGDAPLAFVDLEMTGLGPADRVIEICVVHERGGVATTALDTLVRPDDARFGNAHIHGISAEELASAPTFGDLADAIEQALSGAVYVGHGVRYDLQFLTAEMARLGRSFEIAFPIDTLTLSRRAFAFPSHSLDALAQEFHIERGRAHRASDDVGVLRSVFWKAVGALAPATVRDLFETRIGDREARPAVLESARNAVETGKIVVVRYRPSGRAAESLRMILTAVTIPEPRPEAAIVPDEATRLDPPMVFGYLLPSRGRRDLRADRILSIEVVDDPSTRID